MCLRVSVRCPQLTHSRTHHTRARAHVCVRAYGASVRTYVRVCIRASMDLRVRLCILVRACVRAYV